MSITDYFREERELEQSYREKLVDKMISDIGIRIPSNWRSIHSKIPTMEVEILAEHNHVDTKKLYLDVLRATTEHESIEEYAKHRARRLTDITIGAKEDDLVPYWCTVCQKFTDHLNGRICTECKNEIK